MIRHIVFLQFKPIYSEFEINKAVNKLRGLAQFIPAMKNFSMGKNCSPEGLNQGFTHAFVIDFPDKESRDAYLNHSEHKKIAEEILIPMLVNGIDSAIVIDYEVN